MLCVLWCACRGQRKTFSSYFSTLGWFWDWIEVLEIADKPFVSRDTLLDLCNHFKSRFSYLIVGILSIEPKLKLIWFRKPRPFPQVLCNKSILPAHEVSHSILTAVHKIIEITSTVFHLGARDWGHQSPWPESQVVTGRLHYGWGSMCLESRVKLWDSYVCFWPLLRSRCILTVCIRQSMPFAIILVLPSLALRPVDVSQVYNPFLDKSLESEMSLSTSTCHLPSIEWDSWGFWTNETQFSGFSEPAEGADTKAHAVVSLF